MAFGIPNTIIRVLVGSSHWMTWISSVIVVGITGYFLNNYPRDMHLTYWITIGAITLAFWIPALVLPFLKSYKSYYLPLNLIFSYLWLTAFIFAAQDYNRSSCWANAPTGGSCSLKKTNEAFIFLAFFFSMVALLGDIFGWRESAVTEPVVADKHARTSADTAPAV